MALISAGLSSWGRRNAPPPRYKTMPNGEQWNYPPAHWAELERLGLIEHVVLPWEEKQPEQKPAPIALEPQPIEPVAEEPKKRRQKRTPKPTLSPEQQAWRELRARREHD